MKARLASPAVATPSDMSRHFTEVSSVYRDVRTTDREPVQHIAAALKGLSQPRGADIGCGAGRYVRLMLEIIPGLQLTCVDNNRAMLEQLDRLLAGAGIGGFETRQSALAELELEPGAYDFVSSFNAVHHFDFLEFLVKSRDGLKNGGQLFIYTRLPEHNARSIWGRYFPDFIKKETRLRKLGVMHRQIEYTSGLRFVSATCLRYARRSSLERLTEQARSRHYSTFLFYEPDAFDDALAEFQSEVQRRFGTSVEWHDENILIHAVRDD